MDIADQTTYQRHRRGRMANGEMWFVALIFASMGAICWAIRGTSGWGAIDGTVVPGMMWGVLWWYVCWRKGIDARGIALWLGLGIAIGGVGSRLSVACFCWYSSWHGAYPLNWES